MNAITSYVTHAESADMASWLQKGMPGIPADQAMRLIATITALTNALAWTVKRGPTHARAAANGRALLAALEAK